MNEVERAIYEGMIAARPDAATLSDGVKEMIVKDAKQAAVFAEFPAWRKLVRFTRYRAGASAPTIGNGARRYVAKYSSASLLFTKRTALDGGWFQVLCAIVSFPPEWRRFSDLKSEDPGEIAAQFSFVLPPAYHQSYAKLAEVLATFEMGGYEEVITLRRAFRQLPPDEVLSLAKCVDICEADLPPCLRVRVSLSDGDKRLIDAAAKRGFNHARKRLGIDHYETLPHTPVWFKIDLARTPDGSFAEVSASLCHPPPTPLNAPGRFHLRVFLNRIEDDLRAGVVDRIVSGMSQALTCADKRRGTT